jgi:hypothetical protein
MRWITTCCKAPHQRRASWKRCPTCGQSPAVWRQQLNEGRLIPPDLRQAQLTPPDRSQAQLTPKRIFK